MGDISHLPWVLGAYLGSRSSGRTAILLTTETFFQLQEEFILAYCLRHSLLQWRSHCSKSWKQLVVLQLQSGSRELAFYLMQPGAHPGGWCCSQLWGVFLPQLTSILSVWHRFHRLWILLVLDSSPVRHSILSALTLCLGYLVYISVFLSKHRRSGVQTKESSRLSLISEFC